MLRRKKIWTLLILTVFCLIGLEYFSVQEIYAEDFISKVVGNTYLDASYSFTINKSSSVV